MAIVGKLRLWKLWAIVHAENSLSKCIVPDFVRCSKYFFILFFFPRASRIFAKCKMCRDLCAILFSILKWKIWRPYSYLASLQRILLITCHVCFKVTLWWMLCGIVFLKISCLGGKTCNFFLPKAVFFESCLIQNQVKFADTQFLFMLIWNP